MQQCLELCHGRVCSSLIGRPCMYVLLCSITAGYLQTVTSCFLFDASGHFGKASAITAGPENVE